MSVSFHFVQTMITTLFYPPHSPKDKWKRKNKTRLEYLPQIRLPIAYQSKKKKPTSPVFMLVCRLSKYVFVYSNSIVPGGFELISNRTRLTPRTSLMILLMTFCNTSNGICAASAVMKSMVFTARSATA